MATDKIVVRRQQSGAPGDDAVPVVVGIARPGDVELILHVDQPPHRIGRGRVHADLAVPIDGHEPEGRIDGFVDDGEVQPVAFGNGSPVVDSGASERVDAEADVRATNGVHVDHVAEVADVSRQVVVPMCRARREAPSHTGSGARPEVQP